MDTPTTTSPDKDLAGQDSAVVEQPGAGNIIGAKNDFEAVREWMKAKGQRSKHTFKSYKAEAKKLLVWMMENKLTLNTLNVEGVHNYYNH